MSSVLTSAGGALHLEHVSYRYPEAREESLRDVTLELEPGEFCIVAGTSGSGKSTLLRLACGLVPHFHGGTFSGLARVAGMDLRSHGPQQLAGSVGAVLQDPESQLVMAGVRAELSLPLELRGAGPAATARGVEEAALALGIERLLDRPTHTLSGGERQRVALAAALAPRPGLVVLDEPTSQLDPVAGEELIGLLRRLNEEWGTAVLMAEHRLERCLQAADRVLVMDAGELRCDDAPEGFLRWAAQHNPELGTPGASLFAAAGIEPPPTGVKQARATLRELGLACCPAVAGEDTAAAGGSFLRRPGRWRRETEAEPWALELQGIWHELRRGPAILRGVELKIAPGERVALMGRNGAGKSTLLRHAAGLLAPTRGNVRAAGSVALLLQNPGDYLVAETVGEELGAEKLEQAGLLELAARNPRDLSGGERQRLALAIVSSGIQPPSLLCLDEPTRGMDRSHRSALVGQLRAAPGAVLVATHDPELAAEFAQRVLLMAEGRLIADGPVQEVLTGGWYFATETARILGGGALLPEQGAAQLREQMGTAR